MMYASEEGGRRITAERSVNASCPGCRKPVIAKCGELKVHHWAHLSGCDCDPWHEPETQWHQFWKMQFEERCREVVIGPHRADIKATIADTDGEADCVIELQHSAISPAEIDEREVFYHNRCHTMMWVIDVRSIRDHFVITPQETFAGGTVTRARFKWKWYRQSWGSSHLTGRYLDFGDGLWSIESATADGTGEMRSCTYHEFLSMFEESVGYDLPVHWKPTSTGGFIYRFGGGNVILYQQKSGF